MAAEYELDMPVYQALIGTGGSPDAWLALCPHHTITREYSLVIVDRGDDTEPALRCMVGCEPASIKRILVPDPRRDAEVAALTRALLWAARVKAQRRAAL
jgi:hypothetical protein